jgi:hypothetical protein
MKQLFVLCIMILASLALWGQKAEDILKSKHVIAYTGYTGTYLMDINTGKEVEIPLQDDTYQLIWDKSGTRLFRVIYNKNFGTQEDFFALREIQLPAFTEVDLMSTPVDGSYVLNVEAALGEDGNIYLYELLSEYDEYEAEYYSDWYVTYFYNPVSNKIEELSEGQNSAKDYLPPNFKPVVTKGYGIYNKQIDETTTNHYELFITDKPDAKEPVYRRLTTFKPTKQNINLNGKLIDFWVSPNDSLIAYSYHYYISDPGGDFGYTMVTSRDGKKNMYISDVSSLKIKKDITWSADSRLIYCTDDTENEDNIKLCTLNRHWKVKTLKTMSKDSYPKLYYRYKK